MTDIDVRVLGPLEMEVGGALVPVSAPKERAVLAALALRPERPVAGHELFQALWGDWVPSTARKCVQVHVSRLRSHLEVAGVIDPQKVLGLVGDGYVLRVAPENVDAHRFEQLVGTARRALESDDPDGAERQLVAALGLWRGDPLTDLFDDPLGQGDLTRLTELRLAAIVELNEARLAMGQTHELVPLIEVTLAEEPLREQLWCQLMVALYRSGRQADALRAFQRARGILVEQLGLEPGPELRRIEVAIVAQHPDLDVVTRPARAASVVAPVTDAVTPCSSRSEGENEVVTERATDVRWAQRLRRYPFFGRAHERERLTRAWRNSLSWGTTVAVVSGDAGIGKTRLLAEVVVAFAEQGALVLAGRGTEGGGHFFLPIRQAIDRAAEGVDGDWLLGRLPPTLLALSPDLAEAAGRPCHGDADDPYTIAKGLVRLARTEGPLVLVLDDLHHADVGTCRVVRHLLEHGDGVPLLVLLAYREAGLCENGAARDLLADLHRQRGQERLELAGLPADDAVALLADRLGFDPVNGTREVMGAWSADVAGNPLHLLEVARHAIRLALPGERARLAPRIADLGIPTSLRDQVRHQVRHLALEHRVAIDAAAIVGEDTFDLGVVVGLTGLTEELAITAMDEARAWALVREIEGHPGRYAFASRLVRLAVVEALSAPRRALLDRRLFDFQNAPGIGRATAPARADREVSEAALADLERALQTRQSLGNDEVWCQLLLGLAEERGDDGDNEVARELYELAGEGATRLRRPDLLAEAATGVARAVAERGVSHEGVIELLRSARAGLASDDPRQVGIRAALVPELVWSGRWEEAMTACAEPIV